MNWLDYVVIGILVLNIGLGWFRGLIRSVVNIVSIVLGFICAKMYHLTMYELLNEQFDLLNKFKLGISNTFSNVNLPSLSDAQTLPTDQLLNQLPESEFLSSMVKNFIESDTFNQSIQSSVDSFSDAFSTWLSDKLLIFISMVSIFVLVYLAVRIIGYMLNTIFQLPVLKGVNKLSGLLFGCIKGTFFAMLLVLILVILSPVMSNLNLVETLENSQLAIYFYKYNVVMMVFENFV